VILSAAIAVACERPQARESQRVPVRVPAMLRFADGRTARGETVDLARDGASIALGSAAPLSRQQRVWVSIFSFGEERPLPAAVLGYEGSSVRVRFLGLTLEEETHLVRGPTGGRCAASAAARRARSDSRAARLGRSGPRISVQREGRRGADRRPRPPGVRGTGLRGA